MSLFTLTVARTERVREQRAGLPPRVLEPGRHRRRLRAVYRAVDAREQLGHVVPQEVLTADGVTVKVSAAIRWSVSDPVAFTESAVDPPALVYLAVQLALRDALTDLDASEVVRAARRAVSERLTAAAAETGAAVGVGVRDVVVKDVVLPADLRSAYAEVVSSRQRGQAQLEVARAETAALRSLANAAKLLDEHPALAQLRLVQALPYGAKVVLHAPADA